MTIRPGKNIALKVPRSCYDETVAFYSKAFNLYLKTPTDQATPSCSFELGSNRIWIDCVDSLGRSDVWLELLSDDHEEDCRALISFGGRLRDELETLSERFGHWTADPAGNTLLVAQAFAFLSRVIPQLPSGDLEYTSSFFE